jgi:hypothetical protein
MNRKDRAFLIFMAGAAVLGLCARVDAAQEIAKLMTSDREADDDFGLSVAVGGNWALVGAPGKDDLGVNAGAVYVFRFNGTAWVQEAKLTASDGASGNYFGGSVAISGDYAVVGAVRGRTGATLNTGAAYVFHYDGANWTQQAKLTASDAANSNNFACAVATNGSLTVIGSWGDDALGYDAGAAYVFTRSGSVWTQQQKLSASDGAADDCFGVSVALDGSRLIVGASGDDDYGDDSGSAYIFSYNGSSWIQQQKLTPVDGIPYQFFGESVAIYGDRVIIGASGDSDLGSASGAVYYFARSGATWTATSKLIASDIGPGDCFGNAVAMCDSYALIAARGEHAAYIYVWNGSGWIEQSKLSDPAGGDSDVYGYSVAVDSDHAIVGAFGADDDTGLAYIYDGVSFQVSAVYRFWSPSLDRHFYTISQAERDYVIANWSTTWVYEGISYYAFPEDAVEGLLPVYRFWSSVNESHFYTIDEAERDSVIATYPVHIWAYEGVAFYAYGAGDQPSGTMPVYRFWSGTYGSHFYTSDEAEKDFVIATYPPHIWAFEGIAWYAFPP